MSPGPVVQPALDVFYDGACPLCRREMAHYQRLPADPPVRFVDLSRDALPAHAPTRAALLARLHVRHADGRWQHGAAAFVALWACLPGWRWVARAARLSGGVPLLEGAYRAFLRLRPLWRARSACPDTCPPKGPA